MLQTSDKEVNCSEIKGEIENKNLPGYSSIEELTKDGFKSLTEAIRNANALPSKREYDFYSTHNSFKKILSTEGNHVLSLINNIFSANNIKGNIKGTILDEKTELMVEANDAILEKVANNIDEMNGIKKSTIEPVLIQSVSAQLPINGSWNRITNATFSVTSLNNASEGKTQLSANAVKLLTAKNIIRPQKLFKDIIDNSNSGPWQPRIQDKPNSLKPLALFLERTDYGEEFSHPYEYELDRFTPVPEQLKQEELMFVKSTDDTILIEVNTPKQIDELVETLRSCKEFAVDLEHHSYRSFMGITCLMQISTRECDYIIDTLLLRDKLYLLNEVFTKPSIVKIFHGAESDILWLQRDLSLYVVNMFDTHQAARLLGYSGLSLAYLMNRFCNVTPDKGFQLADWRIRPLPEELKYYAREDTHYLIYIYQKMKNELLKRANGSDNLLKAVIQSSTEICKRRYFKPILTDESHLDFYQKCKRLFDNRQMYALKELYRWRDQICREEDESTGYVLPNHMLLQISEAIPREMQGILACCNPIPPLVRANLLDLHNIILKAREQPLEKPILQEETRARGTTNKMSKINVDSPLHCPHDLTNFNEFRDDLSTLLSSFNDSQELFSKEVKLEIENSKSAYSIFNVKDRITVKPIVKESNLKNIRFLAPYERYKLVRKFIQAEEEELAKRKKEEEEALKKKNGTSSAGDSKEDSVIDNDLSAAMEDNRTDAERIASIREHFLILQKRTEEEEALKKLNEDLSLVEMGGSKKRNHDELISETDDNYVEESMNTPVPNLGRFRGGKGKRKRDGMSPTTNLEGGKPDYKARRKIKKERKKQKKLDKKELAHGNVAGPSTCSTSSEVGTRHPRWGANSEFQGETNDVFRFEASNSVQNSSQPHQNNSNKGSGKKKKFYNKPHTKSNFTPYDYSSVDFRQFQGGASSVQTTQVGKSKFRGRGRGRGGKGFNKSAVFHNKPNKNR